MEDDTTTATSMNQRRRAAAAAAEKNVLLFCSPFSITLPASWFPYLRYDTKYIRHSQGIQ